MGKQLTYVQKFDQYRKEIENDFALFSLHTHSHVLEEYAHDANQELREFTIDWHLAKDASLLAKRLFLMEYTDRGFVSIIDDPLKTINPNIEFFFYNMKEDLISTAFTYHFRVALNDFLNRDKEFLLELFEGQIMEESGAVLTTKAFEKKISTYIDKVIQFREDTNPKHFPLFHVKYIAML